MKHINLILSLLLCTSCATNKSVVGLYGKCEYGYLACTQIELKSDKTFEYFIYMDVGGGTLVKGNWEQISNDSITLNTFDQPINMHTTYKGKVNPNRTDVIKIKIADFEQPLGGAYIVLNNQEEGKKADLDGMVEFKTQEIRTITYHYLGKEETIEIDNPNFNEIEITVKDLELNVVPRYLTDKIVTVHNRKLVINDGFSLKKTKLEDKEWE